MLVSVCACLSQPKWTWYAGGGKPLKDFEIYDDASRGPLGAVQLLFRLKFCHTASIGSLVVLLALASDAFIQQSVSYPLKSMSQQSSHPTVPFAQAYAHTATVPDGAPFLDQRLMAAIYVGMFPANLSHSASSIIPQCPTGNCTFPLYTSLAVCSHCHNVSSLLVYSYNSNVQDGVTLGPDYNYTLPNGLVLSSGNSAVGLLAMKSDSGLNSEDLFPYLGLGAISNTSIITGRYAAWDCVLSFCAKTYNASVSRTVFSEISVATFDQPQWSGPDWPGTNYAFEVPAILSKSTSNQSAVFTVTDVAKALLADQIISTMRGLAAIGTNGYPVFTTDMAQGFYYAETSDIHRTMTNIADALTNAIRVISQDHIKGTGFVLESFVHIEWSWLLFPLVVLSLAVMFLLFTVWHSGKSKVPKWRSSALAVMEFGLSTVTADGQLETESSGGIRKSVRREKLSELEDWAEDTIVRLRTNGLDGKQYGLVAS